jgi:hypothetical protein
MAAFGEPMRVIPFAPSGASGSSGFEWGPIVFMVVALFSFSSIVGTLQALFEWSQPFWPVPVVLIAMFLSSSLVIGWYQASDFFEVMVVGIPTSGCVGLIYLSLRKYITERP